MSKNATCCFIGHREIEESGICVFYYDKNRVFKHRKSGTKYAYEYALRKKANIVLFPKDEKSEKNEIIRS